MGLFSLNNILLENDNYSSTTSSLSNNNEIIDIDNIGYLDNAIQEYSFIQDGYDAILEMNAMYCGAEREFYSRILGSYGDDYIINEGFSDFFDSIKKIIKKFIEWIKKIFKEFVAKLAALVNSDKYIKKHKNLLNKFSSEDEFEFQGFNFTHVADDGIPLSDAVKMFQGDDNDFHKAFNDDYYDALNFDVIFGTAGDATGYYNTSTMKGPNWDSYTELEDGDDAIKTARNNETERINREIDKMRENISDKASDFRDKFRAYVIGKSGSESYDSTEFNEELFKVFRNDETTTEDITIDYNFVQDAYRRFDKYKDVTKAIEKKKNEMVKNYEDLEKHLDKMIKYNKSTYKVDYDTNGGKEYTSSVLNGTSFTKNNKIIYAQSTADKMQSLLKVYSTRVNDMCQIHTQAFTAKLEACKDCFKQDKQILNKAIQKVLKRSNKEDF